MGATFYRIAVDGKVVNGLLYSNRKAALETVKRLQRVYAMNAKVTTRKLRPA